MPSQHPTQSWRVETGDCREILATLESGTAQTCVTSPPYFNQRNYGHEGQIGLEPTPDEFVHAMVDAFRAVRRVLRDDGTVWLNLGDSYAGSGPSGASYDSATTRRRAESGGQDGPFRVSPNLRDRGLGYADKKPIAPPGLKPKDLMGIPWRVAFALQADGWYLRSEIIWAKRNGLPDPAADRPQRFHEHIFLLSKQPRYFYDEAAIREDSEPDQEAHNQRYAKVYDAHTEGTVPNGQPGNVNNVGIHSRPGAGGRGKRSVWTTSVASYAGAHFATFPPKLIEPCILAGSREGDIVLDPFAGSGTTGMVALRHGRSFVGCELNPAYVDLARGRIIADSPLLNTHAEAA
jgi:DNA modification methylase